MDTDPLIAGLDDTTILTKTGEWAVRVVSSHLEHGRRWVQLDASFGAIVHSILVNARLDATADRIRAAVADHLTAKTSTHVLTID